MVGPPGTGKTSLARGLASKTAKVLGSKHTYQYLEVEPHGLASSSLGRSQQAMKHLLGTVIAERAQTGPLIVVLDEVETLAADRQKMSMDANPVDVHRATDAVLAQLDQLAVTYPELLFVATSNFTGAIDAAFLSRADLIVTVDLPTVNACQKILTSTLEALAEMYPDLRRLLTDPALEGAGRRCLGLDGRRIRKVVISALACDKSVAADPSRLTVKHVIQAVEQAQAELKGKGQVSTRVRRNVASTPQRTAMETWEMISALLAPEPTSDARKALFGVAGVAASAISSEGPKDDPIIVHGGGPRAHIYCVYGEDAVAGDGVEEETFGSSPTAGDWKMSIPVPKEDLSWSDRKLMDDSTRVTARAVGEKLKEQEAAVERKAAAIDMQEFMK